MQEFTLILGIFLALCIAVSVLGFIFLLFMMYQNHVDNRTSDEITGMA